MRRATDSGRAMLRTAVAVLSALACLALPVEGVAASDTAYRPYMYDEWREAVASPAGYEAVRIVFGDDMGAGPLDAPTDFSVGPDGDLYVLDGGHGRILRLDASYRLKKEIVPLAADGAPSPLSSPQGLFVDADGSILVADTAGARVLVLDPEGRILQEFTKPTSELYPQKEAYRPEKLLRDPSGITYVICAGIPSGMLMYSPQGDFLGFFGSNPVNVSLKLLADRFWKSVFSTENRSKFANYIPVESNALDIDADGFLFAVTAGTSDRTAMVRKLNSLGVNILQQNAAQSFQKGFGDMNPYVYNRVLVSTRLVDVVVSAQGWIDCLDAAKGRVFQYDGSGNLLFVVGGIGNQLGLFIDPTAVEAQGNRILVLDKGANSMTVFERTEFGAAVHEAIALYDEGYLQESIGPWRKVLTMDSNYNVAYIGLGKAAFESGDYAEAMKDFRIAGYVEGHDQAYREYRKELIRSGFPLFALVLGLLVLLVLVVRAARRRYAGLVPLSGRMPLPVVRFGRDLKVALSVPLHPMDGFDDLLDRRQQSRPVAFFFLAVFFVAAIAQRQLTGYDFNASTRLEELNILYILGQTVVLCVAFAAVNWSVCTLFDGKGRFREILVATTYALQPYLYAIFLTVLLSNFLTRDEGVFLDYLMVLGQVYSVVLLVKGIEAVHRYSLRQAIYAIVATVLGLLVLIILLILSLSLVQQIVGFFTTLYQEYTIRFR